METIAIKELAYFTCQSGNLTTEFFSNHDMLKGQKAHDYLQEKYNNKSLSEVYIKKEINHLGKNYLLHGYIDGVLNIAVLSKRGNARNIFKELQEKYGVTGGGSPKVALGKYLKEEDITEKLADILK